MIPLRDVIPSRTAPVITLSLIVVNLLAFSYELALGEDANEFLLRWGMVPSAFSWVTVMTSMFLHRGILHIAANMVCLWLFGDTVEDRMGHGRFLVFYVLCGIVAAVAQTVIGGDANVPIVGASGAIAGVMGAYFVLYPKSRVITFVPMIVFIQIVEVPAFLVLGVWLLLQFLSGVGSIIPFWAHVAGFAVGMTAVLAFRRPERLRVEWWHDV
jgi:membrane associated rhomboid family serine protease